MNNRDHQDIHRGSNLTPPNTNDPKKLKAWRDSTRDVRRTSDPQKKRKKRPPILG